MLDRKYMVLSMREANGKQSDKKLARFLKEQKLKIRLQPKVTTKKFVEETRSQSFFLPQMYLTNFLK